MSEKWDFIIESVFQNINKAIEEGIDEDPEVSPEVIEGMAHLHSAIVKSRSNSN